VQIGIIIKHSYLLERTTRTDVFSAVLTLYEIAAEIARNRRKKWLSDPFGGEHLFCRSF